MHPEGLAFVHCDFRPEKDARNHGQRTNEGCELHDAKHGPPDQDFISCFHGPFWGMKQKHVNEIPITRRNDSKIDENSDWCTQFCEPSDHILSQSLCNYVLFTRYLDMADAALMCLLSMYNTSASTHWLSVSSPDYFHCNWLDKKPNHIHIVGIGGLVDKNGHTQADEHAEERYDNHESADVTPHGWPDEIHRLELKNIWSKCEDVHLNHGPPLSPP